ncbi:hypothetical protein [Kitasatospora sp. NPDC057198]|uniref:hypothetical protein n=1 Tax=Kitasatospora sp. NPDC057198 TaxID=3346046 RepID=UPI0036257765
MAKIRPSTGRDALFSAGLVALEVPLLCLAVYAAMGAVFAQAAASERGGGAGGALVLCGVLAAVGLGVPLAALVATARRGYRIAPLALGLAGPVLTAVGLGVLRP